MKRSLAVLTALGVITLAACTDNSSVAPRVTGDSPSYGVTPKARVDLQNYVAIGTSVSMGVASGGVNLLTQEQSWPNQLAHDAGVEFTQPLIQLPGCTPPYAAPLISFQRIDGSSITDETTCSPNVAGVTLPTHNLAVDGAKASDALNTTSATATGGKGPVTSRVLPPGMTQVAAMQLLQPTFVSVEFGGNEILPAQVGIIIPDVTIVPFPTFSTSYTAVIDAVKATGAKAVLVTLLNDLRTFPTLRTGPEIASQRSAFTAYNVSVSFDCDDSPNYIFVRGKVPTAIIAGITMAGMGLGPYTLSCADVPFTQDYVLTPADISTLNALAAQMNNLITQRAQENGYALFSLGVLYDHVKGDVPFDLQSFLLSPTPYGPKISLDGVHPSGEGQKVLARAARVAINQTYGSNP
jgi:hypothetical protein